MIRASSIFQGLADYFKFFPMVFMNFLKRRKGPAQGCKVLGKGRILNLLPKSINRE